eukprot:2794505-Amphidinium_carterae.1
MIGSKPKLHVGFFVGSVPSVGLRLRDPGAGLGINRVIHLAGGRKHALGSAPTLSRAQRTHLGAQTRMPRHCHLSSHLMLEVSTKAGLEDRSKPNT